MKKIGLNQHRILKPAILAFVLCFAGNAAQAVVIDHRTINTSAATGHLTVLAGANIDDIAVGTSLAQEVTDLIATTHPQFTGSVFAGLLQSGSGGKYAVGLTNLDFLTGTLTVYGNAGQVLVDEFTQNGNAAILTHGGHWINPPTSTFTGSQSYSLFGGPLPGSGGNTVVVGTADVAFYSVSGSVQLLDGADLAVTKTAAPNPVQVGSNLTYTVTVTNNGSTDPATGVTLTDTLPAGVTFVSATPSQGMPCTQAGGTVTCNLGNVAMATPATVSIVVTPTQAGSITNTAAVAGIQIDNTPANDSAQVTTTVNAPPPPPSPPTPATGADLSIRKLASVNPVAGGSLLIYTLNIDNRGPLAASDVRVIDNLPAGMDLILAYASQGTCEGAVNVLCHLGSLANGDKASVLLAVRPQSTPGTLINFASVGSATHDPKSYNNLSGVISNVIASAPTSATLALNAAAFRTGDSLSLNASVDPGAASVLADIYLALRLPDGTTFFRQPAGSYATAVMPAFSNAPLSAVAGNLLNYTFIGPEPAGQYEWFLAAFRAGTADLIGPISTAPFTYSP